MSCRHQKVDGRYIRFCRSNLLYDRRAMLREPLRVEGKETTFWSATQTFAAARMLQEARMAGLMKLHCSVGTIGEWLVRAGSDPFLSARGFVMGLSLLWLVSRYRMFDVGFGD